MTPQLRIRHYTDGDHDALKELLDSKRVLSEEEWNVFQWRMNGNPYKEPYILLVVYDDKVIGCFLILPQQLMIDKKVVDASWGASLLIHPEYRKVGLAAIGLYHQWSKETDVVLGVRISSMARRILDKMRFMVRIPTLTYQVKINRAVPALKYLGLKGFAYPAAGIFFPFNQAYVRGRKIMNKIGRGKKGRNYIIREVTHFDKRFDDFWNKVKGDYEIIAVRDAQFLNWRYGREHPVSNYRTCVCENNKEVLGYITTRCEKIKGVSWGFIVDMLSNGKKEVAQQLIEAAEKSLSSADVIVSCFSDGKIRNNLAGNGFVNTFKNPYFYCFSRNDKINSELRSKKWYVSFGDSDGP
jgi:hypothetical protein